MAAMSKQESQIQAVRALPAEVALAREALGILAAEGGLADGLSKKLPAFAVNSARAGKDVTLDYLLTHARAGTLDVADPFNAVAASVKTYADIRKIINRTYDPYAKLTVRGQSMVASYLGDVEKLRNLYKGERIHRISFKDEGRDVPVHPNKAMIRAAEAGHIDAVLYFRRRGYDIDPIAGNAPSLRSIAQSGSLPVLKHALKFTRETLYSHDYQDMMTEAARKGHVEVVRFLTDSWTGVTFKSNLLMRIATGNGCLDLVKYLLREGAPLPANNGDLDLIGENGQYHVMKFMIENGVRRGAFLKEHLEEYEQYLAVEQTWQAQAGRSVPSSLVPNICSLRTSDPAALDPKHLSLDVYELAFDGLRQEKYSDRIASEMALNAALLFDTPLRFMRFFEKYARPGKQPLHDLIQHVKLPQAGISSFDVAIWRDAVMSNGPSMLRLVKYADKLGLPCKAADGKNWSSEATREAAAAFAYNSFGAVFPDMTAFCIDYDVETQDFEKALGYKLKQTPSRKNIPDLIIAGEEFGLPGGKLYRLAPDDYRGLFLGKMTDCCQSVGGFGNDCAVHGYTSEDGGFYVIENARGDVLGQTWAWRGDNGEMVLDTLETLGTRVSDAQWESALKCMADKIGAMKTNVTALHVGLGGDTPESLSGAFNQPAKAAVPRAYEGYRESENQLCIAQFGKPKRAARA